jgi:hypothetical protein
VIKNLGPIPQVDHVTDQDVIHLYDYVNLEYLQQELATKGRPRYVTGDHFLTVEHALDIDYRGVLLWLERQVDQWKQASWSTELNTTHCFNFMVNRRQTNRFLLIKLVEAFELTSYDYTWSGHGREFNLTRALEEFATFDQTSLLTDQQKFVLLQSIGIEPRFIDVPQETDTNDNFHVRAISPGTHIPNNKWPWDHGLDQMFLNSAVSLISESQEFDRGQVYTEKTLYSVLGLTLPIWVGGYGQAHHWAQIGFDTFDDVVDHSYQFADSLLERCVLAFKLNQPLLSDLAWAAQCRERCRERLLHNRELLLSGQIQQFNQARMAAWPEDLKQFLPEIQSNLSNGPLGPWVFRKCS